MQKSFRLLVLVFVLVGSFISQPFTQVHAASIPAEINKQFTPLQIDAGGTSVLRISIFNPNTFPLTNVAFTDNLIRRQAGLFVDAPNGVVNTCGGTVTAVPGSTTVLLSGGGVPAQVGSTPGQCYVEINISSVTAGNLINEIPAHNPGIGDIGLTANGVDAGTPVTVTNTTPANSTLTVIAVDPPTMTKIFNPTTIFVGDVSLLTIRVNNNDVDTNLTGATYTDTLPSGLTVSSPANITRTNCGGSSSVTAPSGGTTITLSNAIITPSLDCVVTLNVRGVTAGQYINRINAGPGGPGSLQTDQGVTNNGNVDGPLNVQPVGVTKAYSPTTIDAGDTTTLTITLQNPTNVAEPVTEVIDSLPANLTMVGSPSTTCGGTVIYDSTPTASWELSGSTIPSGTMAVPGTCTITAVFQADLTFSGTRTNTIGPNAIISPTPGFTNYLGTSSTVTINPALSGTKAYAAPFAIPLDGLNLVTITLNNNSSAAFTDVDFTDTLPTGLTVATTSTVPVAPANPTTTCTDGIAPDPSVTNAVDSVSLADGEIAPNSNCTITFYVTSSTPGSGTTYENVIPINDITACTASLGCVGNNSNITTGTDLTVVNAPQLPVTVAKSFSAAVVAPGVPSRVRITITAPLDIAISQISITDTLPVGVVVAPNVPPTPLPTESCPGGSVTAIPGSNTISYSNLVGNTLNAGASCNIDVYVVAAEPGSYDNVVPSGTITTSQGRTNTFDSNIANLRVTGMTMSKAFYPSTVQANGISTLTITLENSTAYALTNVDLNDGLPGSVTNGIIVAPGPVIVNTCGGTVTATVGSQSIILDDGTIPAQSGSVPGICTISVDVQGKDSSPASQSTQTNTIPIANVTGDIVTLGVTISPSTQAQAILTIRNLSIGVVKGFDPVLVYGGGTSTMTVQLINPNGTVLTGVAFTDNMALISSGIILANPVDFDTGTCGGTLTGNPGDSSFSFSGGTILANSSCSITLSVVMNVNGNRTNRIPAGAVSTTSGVNSTQATEASLTNLPGVSVNKVFNPNPVQINQISNLTITITNTSSVPVVNMEVNDNLPGLLPAGLVIATPSNATTNCGGTLTADPNTQIISLDGGGLPGNGTCQIVVDVVSTEPGVYVNTIPAGALTADGGVQNNDPASDSLTVGTLFSLGNRVWFDTNNNSLIGSSEVGVDGVVVQLYAADSFSGLPTGAVLDTQTTAFGGYYRFDDLPEGDYVVVIPRDNFNNVGVGDLAPTNPLAGYWSSGTSISGVGVLAETTAPDPDDDTDSEDNGTWQSAGTFLGAVISSPVTLGTNAVPAEPTNETDVSVPNPSGEADDDRSNLTVDFGFYRTVIGDLIFVDFPAANGSFGGSDTALPGAVVQLFASDGVTEINVGPDGIFGTDDDASGGVTTGLTGLYTLSGLPNGDYIVRVTPPTGYQSTIDTSNSSDNADPDFNINNNDNGIGILTGAVSSGILTMTAGETGSNITVTQSSGTTNDVSVDFGFTSISYSLGNRVWFDTDNSSTINGSEVGVNNVRVDLYDSLNTLIAFDMTDASGYYRFDGLNAGDYTVRIPASEFIAGSPLAGYWSSGTTMAANGSIADSTANDPDVDTDDSDDNGITTFGVNAVNSVSAGTVTLGPGAVEPTNDNDPTQNSPTPAGEAPNDRSNRTVDFGFYHAELSNQIFTDVNKNGTYDAGDLPHDGATVQLFASNGTTEINVGPDGVFGTADDAAGGITTGAGGTYLFSHLPQGSYIVKVTPQAGFTSTVDTASAADTTTPNTNVNDNDNGVGLAAGQVSSNAIPLTPGSAGAASNNTVTHATGTTSNPTMDFGFITPQFSLGNRVWFDTNNNSTIDLGEMGVDGIQVDLYAADGSGDPTGAVLDTQTTSNGGYYRFDTLDPGSYVVVIPATEFDAGSILMEYWSSGTTLSGSGATEASSPDPDDDVDNDDNGELQSGGTFSGAVISQAVTLGPGALEPINDTDTDPTNPAGEATNDRSNLTVDFGFYRITLSNQIFTDVNNNGTYDGGDLALVAATVQLFGSDGTTEINVGPDGVFGTADDAAGGVTTGAGGTYLFSRLPQGIYIVKVTPPAGYTSTVDTASPADSTSPDANIDDNDNGIGIAGGQVSSNAITLTPGSAGAAANNTVDNPSGTTSNPTMDFGFNVPLYSLGNRVWFDADNDRTIDAGTEVGVDGVTVNLYAASDLSTILATQITADGGYYRFDNLIGGDYVVVIPASEFDTSGPLIGYVSSGTSITSNGTISEIASTDPDDDADNDDNGMHVAGDVISKTITLGPGINEPINDTDAPSPNPAGEAVDNQSNRTVDFGFYRLQLGNQIFIDVNRNGTYDAGDAPLVGAIVQLYSGDGTTEIHVGPDGVLGTSDDAVGGMTTGVGGVYQFSGLSQGDYVVTMTPPAGFTSTVDTANATDTTTPNTNINDNDNGIGTGGGQIFSNLVTLTPGSAGAAANNTVTNTIASTYNPTMDFGVAPLYSLGNRVWFDTDNDSTIDSASEVGVDGVTVNLYAPGDLTTILAITTTANGGYYRFDNLIAGNYVVSIEGSEFDAGGTLLGYWSSGTTLSGAGTTEAPSADPNNDADNDDNGSLQTSGPLSGTVASQLVTLGPGITEPTTDSDAPSPNPVGEAPNDQSNRTVDFGFYRVELSNQVFVDIVNDSTYGAGDFALPGATVQLFASNGTTEINVGPDGIFGTADDAAGGVVTNPGGVYLFSGLPQGSYVVSVTPPAGYASVVDSAAPTDVANPNVNTDDNDNGVGTTTGQVFSNVVTLTPGNASINNVVDDATGTTTNPTLDFGFIAGFTKTIISTDATHTTDPEVTIGEIVTYEINLMIPVGTLQNVRVVDTPQNGLAFVDCISITLPANVTSTTTTSGVCNTNDGDTVGSNPLIENSGGRATFDFGDVTNSTTTLQPITIQYSLIVLDISANQNGVARNNSAVWSWTGGSKVTSATPLEVVEPQMTIDKNATPTSSALGTVITFTIDIAHDLTNSTADAFDVIVTDQIPAGLEFVPGSITNSGTATLTSSNYNVATNTLTFVWDVFRLNETASVSFDATFVGPSPVVNSASVEWTSLLIDPQQPGPPPVLPQLSPYNPDSTERWYDPTAPAGVDNYVVSDTAIITQLIPRILPSTGFAPGVVTQLPKQPADLAYAQTDLWVEIPQLKVKLNIVGVPFGEGTKDWDLKWLGSNAGWLDGTAFPTHNGNSALTAHSTLSNGKPGPFANLGLLKYGDQIIVHLGGQKYIYEIRENKSVLPSAVASVLKHEELSWLTLITCKSYNETTGEYTYRNVVRAVLIKVVDE